MPAMNLSTLFIDNLSLLTSINSDVVVAVLFVIRTIIEPTVTIIDELMFSFFSILRDP